MMQDARMLYDDIDDDYGENTDIGAVVDDGYQNIQLIPMMLTQLTMMLMKIKKCLWMSVIKLLLVMMLFNNQNDAI